MGPRASTEREREREREREGEREREYRRAARVKWHRLSNTPNCPPRCWTLENDHHDNRALSHKRTYTARVSAKEKKWHHTRTLTHRHTPTHSHIDPHDTSRGHPEQSPFFSRKKSSKQVFALLFFFLSSFFPSSFWRRVPRLAPSYRTILVKQILNQWMNLKRTILYFLPKIDRRLGEDCKTTGETQCYTKNSH